MSEERKSVIDPWIENKMEPEDRLAAIRNRARASTENTRCAEFAASQPWKIEKMLVGDGYHHEWSALAAHVFQDIHFLLGMVDLLNARIAATRRPPNKPLTMTDMVTMDKSDAVWVISKDGDVCVVNGLDALDCCGYEYESLFFKREPTPADIEAARKEHANE